MDESQRLAKEYERALGGGAWHGPSWREVLPEAETSGWRAVSMRKYVRSPNERPPL